MADLANSKIANAPQTTKHAFLVLDALRGVAAGAVVLFHCIGEMYNWEWFWPSNATLAVDFFFLLSGFVIAHAYQERLTAGMTLTRFTILRLIRLYPLFWLGTSIAVAVPMAQALLHGAPLTMSLVPRSYFLNVLFIPAHTYKNGIAAPVLFDSNSPSWSLSLEMAINIIFALVCSRLSIQRLKLLVLLGACFLLWTYWKNNDASLGWDWQHYDEGWARVVFSFFAGVLLYRYFMDRQRTALAPYWALVLAAVLFACFTTPRYTIAYSVLACFIIFPAVVWYGARATIWQPFRRLCGWVGRLSYSVYITHIPFLKLLMATAVGMGIDIYPHPRTTALVFAFLVLVAAALLDRYFDVPLRTFLGQKFRMKYAR